MRLTEVRTHHVRETLDQLAGRPAKRGLGVGRTLSSRTLAPVRGRLRSVFREAHTAGLVASDPTAADRRVEVV